MKYSAIWIASSLSLVGGAHATDLYSSSIQIDPDSATQLRRLNRSGVPSDWSVPKEFPGVLNSTTDYHYATFDLDIGALEAGYTESPYLQITFDSESFTTFLSAYLGAYDPTDLSLNYLGDEGFSGNGFPGDPNTFQIVVPPGGHVVLVLNESQFEGGIGQSGEVLIEGFADTQYTDLAPVSAVPEPANWALLAGGVGLLALIRRRSRPVSHPN